MSQCICMVEEVQKEGSCRDSNAGPLASELRVTLSENHTTRPQDLSGGGIKTGSVYII